MKLDEIAGGQRKNSIFDFEVEGDNPQTDETETLEVHVWEMPGPNLEDTEFTVYNQRGEEVDPDQYGNLSTEKILKRIDDIAQKQAQKPGDADLGDSRRPEYYDEPRIADPNDRR